MKDQIGNGTNPYKLQLVGLELGGKPIEEYAPDFWLISDAKGGKPVGYITSPWYHPEKNKILLWVMSLTKGIKMLKVFLLEILVKNIKFIYQKIF